MATILGIESSCDETAAAVVSSGPVILSSVVSSQTDVHGRYGGVVPELASREHLRAIVPVVAMALEEANVTWTGLDAVAVTKGPGLAGSLLVGITYAKAICAARKLPLIGINHLEGHVHAVLMEAGSSVEFPALALVASGGHTHLYSVTPQLSYTLLGKTRDDAAGEAYDKVAKLLGFSYPGGPILDSIAPYGNPNGLSLPLAKMKGNRLDFSFSGLKTAMLRWVESGGLAAEIGERKALTRRNAKPTLDEWLAVTPQTTRDAIAAFQQVVIEELLRRIESAADDADFRSIVISGGVACNQGLRQAAQLRRLPCPVFFPVPSLSTDNAAMIAAAALRRLDEREFDGLDLRAYPNLTLG